LCLPVPADLHEITDGLERYRADLGRYPSEGEGLQALVTDPKDRGEWHGPYVRRAIVTDPWGTNYHYTTLGRDGRDFEVSSPGRDGSPNTIDDISTGDIPDLLPSPKEKKAALLYNVPAGELTLRVTAEFAGDADAGASLGGPMLIVDGALTTMYSLDRTGTIAEAVTLHGYLRRAKDNAWLADSTVVFEIDGRAVGSGTTNVDARADLTWAVADGAAERTITAAFEGDDEHLPSSATAALACETLDHEDGHVRSGGGLSNRTELKARLLRSDNVPLYNKAVSFYVDGTYVIARPTSAQGYASYAYYTVPDAGGAGKRTILAEWSGDAGYAAISKTAALTVLKAIPYIYVQSKSVPSGAIASLYAYFRRLYDYQKQIGKVVTFSIDGTAIQSLVTDANGIARYYHWTNESVGVHTIRCEFAGDEWLDPGYGEATLTIL